LRPEKPELQRPFAATMAASAAAIQSSFRIVSTPSLLVQIQRCIRSNWPRRAQRRIDEPTRPEACWKGRIDGDSAASAMLSSEGERVCWSRGRRRGPKLIAVYWAPAVKEQAAHSDHYCRERCSGRSSPGRVHHEKNFDPRSRMRAIRLGCFCPGAACRHRRTGGAGLREQGRDQRHSRAHIG
jgi:hypothetical protein